MYLIVQIIKCRVGARVGLPAAQYSIIIITAITTRNPKKGVVASVAATRNCWWASGQACLDMWSAHAGPLLGPLSAIPLARHTAWLVCIVTRKWPEHTPVGNLDPLPTCACIFLPGAFPSHVAFPMLRVA